jgi:hypothetical protein
MPYIYPDTLDFALSRKLSRDGFRWPRPANETKGPIDREVILHWNGAI